MNTKKYQQWIYSFRRNPVILVVSLLGFFGVFVSNMNYALTEQLKPEPNPLISSQLLSKLRTSPYDDATFTVAFQTLLFNSNIKDAFQLALIGLAKQPNSIEWHQRVAQTAVWVGEYDLGLKEWLYVLNSTKDVKNLEYAIKASEELSYYGVEVQLLKIYLSVRPKDNAAILKLGLAYNRNDEPQKAIALLIKLNQVKPSIDSYALLARIYTDLGQWDNALKVWQLSDKKFGPTVRSVLAQAEIYYTREQLLQALSVIKSAIPVAKAKDDDFWQTFGDLAFLINDRKSIVQAYGKAPHTKNNLTRLVGVIGDTDPAKGAFYNAMGWNRYHDMAFLSSLLYLNQVLNRWEDINNTLMKLTPNQVQEIQKQSIFWSVQSAFWGFLGATDLQKQVLVNGVLLHPNLLGIQSDLLWVVNGRGEYLWVRALMQQIYQHNQIDEKEIWHAFAEGFAVLNQFYNALVMYQRHLDFDWNQEQIRIDYAENLNKADLYQQALSMREFIWKNAQKIYYSGSAQKPQLYLQTLAQIAPYFASGTVQVAYMNALFLGNGTQDNVNILLNWLVPRNYFDLIYYMQYAYLNGVLPDWAGINLALLKNDTQALQDIMTHTDRDWPRSDRINAAVRLENKPLAVDYAFRELTDRRLANEIYPEFTLYGLELANHAGIGQEYEQFINLVGPRTYLDTQFRLTNSLRIIPKASIWWVSSNQLNQITNVPPQDERAEITLEQIIHRGKALYSIGVRKALNTFVPASIKVFYTLAAKWTAIFSAEYNEPNLLDSYMFIGGVDDQIGLTLMYNYTKRDLFSLELQGVNYYGQDRHYLGDGVNVFAYAQHKFWLNYPDFTLGAFAHSYVISHNGSLGGDITTLFPKPPPQILANPAQASALYNFEYQQVLPNSFYEGGFTFSVGDTIVEYTHSWRPYFWGSIYYNTITQLSYNVKGGINGTVFGRDSLLIYAEEGTAPATINSTTYRIGARYMLYF